MRRLQSETIRVSGDTPSGNPPVDLRLGGLRDFRQLADLLQSEYGFLPDGSSEKYYRWLYHDNPNGAAIVGNAECGRELVGHYAVVPMRIWFEGREKLAGVGVNALTRRGFQGRSVFARLAALVAEAVARQGIYATYVVPSPQSRPWFVKFLGFIECGPVRTWVRPLRCVSILRSLAGLVRPEGGAARIFDAALMPLLRFVHVRRNPYGLEIKKVHEFGEEFDALWEGSKSQYRFSVVRKCQYLRWRFSMVPTRQYQLWSAYDHGRLVSYVAVRVREFRQHPGLKVGVIADLFGKADRVGLSGAGLLVSQVLQWLSRENVSLCMMQLMSPILEPALKANGFFLAPGLFVESRALLFHLLSQEAARLPIDASFHFTGGDHDMG